VFFGNHHRSRHSLDFYATAAANPRLQLMLCQPLASTLTCYAFLQAPARSCKSLQAPASSCNWSNQSVIAVHWSFTAAQVAAVEQAQLQLDKRLKAPASSHNWTRFHTAMPCPVMSAAQVASSFSHMLNLHNLTEEVANTQTERAGRMGEVGLDGAVAVADWGVTHVSIHFADKKSAQGAWERTAWKELRLLLMVVLQQLMHVVTRIHRIGPWWGSNQARVIEL
jgi:hypothetical protein